VERSQQPADDYKGTLVSADEPLGNRDLGMFERMILVKRTPEEIYATGAHRTAPTRKWAASRRAA
jgi:hypothetical protein